MDRSYRIIISTSSLNIEDWTDLYRFIDSIYTNDKEENRIDSLQCLKERCIEVWYSHETNTDIYQLDGQDLTDDALKQLPPSTNYRIIYNKCDDIDDVFGLAHFIKFAQRFTLKTGSGSYLSLVSLDIYTGGMEDQEKASSFKLKCNNFITLLLRGVKPILCNKSLVTISNYKIVNRTVIKEITSEKNRESHNWMKHIDIDAAFPKEWQEEKFVNNNESSPISSYSLMGVPQTDNCEEREHQKNLDKLYEIRNDLYKGHIEASNSHIRFFIDTESFVRRVRNNRKGEFIKWIDELKYIFQSSSMLKYNKLDILITPSAESESDFISTVNNSIFGGKAFVLHLDVHNRRNSFIDKFSFLKYLDKDSVRYHYVDHILFTGETFHKTKSFLSSFIGNQNDNRYLDETNQNLQRQNTQETHNTNKHFRIFDSIITVINHLPYTRNKEIKNDVNRFFTFINLYYPSSRFKSRDCQLCRLENYYNELSKKTVLDNCQTIIHNYLEKIELKNIKTINKNSGWSEIKRNFLRLVMTHELCFRLSQIAWGKSDFYDITRNEISEELDSIYCLLSNQNYSGAHQTKSNINQRINNWFDYNLNDDCTKLREFINEKLETDKKISFLKVISSPPLSQYNSIREYAHSKLLSVLYEILHEKNNNDYTYDDLKIVKSILKSLSFLKSNALVRKEVIVGVWKVLGTVIDNNCICNEINKINKYVNIIQEKTKKIEKKQDKEHLTSKLVKQSDKLKDCLKYLKSIREGLDKFSKDEVLIKDFSRDIQFFIKNAIVEDDVKATILGELIRRGTEMSSFNQIKISKTKLSLKDGTGQNSDNDLFECFQDEKMYPNLAFRTEYINFLVCLFYDNTTIIRRTLDSISKELEKDDDFKLLFYNNYHKLKSTDELRCSISNICMKFKEKINHEYYYSSFQPYIYNEDRIDYVEKLIYVTYAKLKLEDLIVNKNITNIETDTKALSEIFTEIMGANASFFTMKKGKKLFPISIYWRPKEDQVDEETDDLEEREDIIMNNTENISSIENQPTIIQRNWNYKAWDTKDFYIHQIFSWNRINSPIFLKYDVRQKNKDTILQSYGEYTYLRMHSLSSFVITSSNNNKSVIASFTFLYDKENPLIIDKNTFRTCTQEYGRLLLLLKQEIDKYVIDYLIKDKVFDLWIEKHKSFRKFDKIYANSDHIFHSVHEEMDEFEHTDKKTISQFHKTWFFLANETISFLYSNIEKNVFPGDSSKHFLDLHPGLVIDEKNTIGDTFNDHFITLLSVLLKERWNSKMPIGEKSLDNEIVINNKSLDNFSFDDDIKNAHLYCKKYLIRTFIVQCLHNSLSPISRHGHRMPGEVKRVIITISRSTITIEDTFIKDSPIDSKKRRATLFNSKQKHIRQMNCDEYSSTTLTSLQGFVNYMRNNKTLIKNGIRYNCYFGFKKNYNFIVKIIFNSTLQ